MRSATPAAGANGHVVLAATNHRSPPYPSQDTKIITETVGQIPEYATARLLQWPLATPLTKPNAIRTACAVYAPQMWGMPHWQQTKL
jgi:hypothetical protein